MSFERESYWTLLDILWRLIGELYLAKYQTIVNCERNNKKIYVFHNVSPSSARALGRMLIGNIATLG